MNDLSQVRYNIDVFKSLKPLSREDEHLINRVVEVMKSTDLIECSHCRYCMAVCPKEVKIPWIFSVMNQRSMYEKHSAAARYYSLHTREGGRASDCIECGKCAGQCPQMLPIPGLLKKAAEIFEPNSAK